MSVNLINHLKVQRAKAGITQAELADAVQVSRKTINTIENRIFVPSTLLALKIANHLSLSIHELFELVED